MKIIGYCRVSTDAQSVKSQVLKIRTYAKQHKMKIDKFIEDVNGISMQTSFLQDYNFTAQ